MKDSGTFKKYPVVLTVAGSDSGGGAGIQADIKAISATGAYAASAVTAVTAQNTLGVNSIHAIPETMVEGQIDAVLSDIGADAVKTGMLPSAGIIRTVSSVISRYGIGNLVVDPVMVATSGHRLMAEDAARTMIESLIPLSRIITPNIPEAEVLAGVRIEGYEGFEEVAERLSLGGKVSVLLKGGHFADSESNDLFYNAENNKVLWLSAPRIDTCNTHGTGCTLSAAIASFLAQGHSLESAVRSAKEYLTSALKSGSEYKIGGGHGPLDHFYYKTRPR